MKELCFDGSGSLLFYYFGVAKFIQENYNLDDVIFTGRSGGCLVILLLSLNINLSSFIDDFTMSLNEISNNNSFGLFTLISKVRHYISDLTKNIPNKLDIINKKLNLHVTVIKKIFKLKYENRIVSNWNTYDDFIDIICCAIYIPFYGKNFFYSYKNERYIDGAVLANMSKKYEYKELTSSNLDKKFTIELDKWRNVKKYYPFFLMNFNINFSKKMVDYGYEDALNNKNELDDFFHT